MNASRYIVKFGGTSKQCAYTIGIPRLMCHFSEVNIKLPIGSHLAQPKIRLACWPRCSLELVGARQAVTARSCITNVGGLPPCSKRGTYLGLRHGVPQSSPSCSSGHHSKELQIRFVARRFQYVSVLAFVSEFMCCVQHALPRSWAFLEGLGEANNHLQSSMCFACPPASLKSVSVSCCLQPQSFSKSCTCFRRPSEKI